MRQIAYKYFEDQATEAEKRELLEWLRHKENRLVFSKFKLDWESDLGHDWFPVGGGKTWSRLQEELWKRSFSRWQDSRKTYKFLRIAAIFFFVLSVGSFSWFYINQRHAMPEIFTSVVTDNGQMSKVELPDGSKVWLNFGSRISYSNYYSAENRKVTLFGEAYFDVVKNEDLPLIVDCNGLLVRVLGTKFNVKAYNEPHGSIEVVLEKGQVELENPKSGDVFYKMKPGERVQIDMLNNRYSAGMVNTFRYTSWKEGIINIHDQSIEELIKQLEKRYKQQFELADDVKRLRYTFTIENESLGDVLKLMEHITPIKVKQKDDIITISADETKLKKAGG
ncbi:FecR family protein [Mariniphaga anaerophila]|uniref:FecR family protein n=1 Tax=Mariniphaga anaerophila TaxID=1484053 RepID=A0A1M5G2G2_9BACT|nr:FecR domain-containing protein [Mariniphaga anaerophila]SHF97918.1 FecR family protein [Mariniphaga anaerophila]